MSGACRWTFLFLLVASSVHAAPDPFAPVPLGPPDPTVRLLSSDEWTTILAKLGSDSFAEREAGQRELKRLQLENLAALRARAGREPDPEVKARLDMRLKEMTSEFKTLVDQAANSERGADADKMLSLYQRVVTIDPEDRALGQRYGDMLQDAGKHAEAIRAYTRVIELTDGKESQLFVCRGVARANSGDARGGLADLTEALRLTPGSALAYFNRALIYQDLGDLDAAIADATKAIEADPNYTDAYYDRGTFRHNKGDQVGAIADFDQAIRLRPDYAYAYCNRGFARQVKGEPDAALTDFATALTLNPKQPWVHADRGTIYFCQARWKEALQDFQEQMTLDPNNPEGYLMAWVVRCRLGEAAGAGEDLKLFLALDKEAPTGKRKIVAFVVGKVSEESLLSDAAVTGSSANGAGYFYAGISRLNAGQKKEAAELLEKALKVAGPNSLVRQNAAAELKRLRDTP